MPVTRSQVEAMLYPFLNMQLTDKEKHVAPKKSFVDNFNRTLAAAKLLAPEVDSLMWPNPIGFDQNGECDATYFDIQVYANQISNHFPVSFVS